MRDDIDGAPFVDDTQAPEGERTIVIEDEALRRGFTQLPNYLFQVRGLSHSAKLTYALILSYAWQKDYCFPGQETLARDLEVSTRSVIEYLKELQAHGLIRIQRRGLGKTNIYHILRYPPSPQDTVPPSHQEVKRSSHQQVNPRSHQDMPASSHPQMRDAADPDVRDVAPNKNASLKKQTPPEKTRQQHKRAAAHPPAPAALFPEAPVSGGSPAAAARNDGARRLARLALQAYGIRNGRLLDELCEDPDEVLVQVERLQREMERAAVVNPAGWLVEAIRERYRIADPSAPGGAAAPSVGENRETTDAPVPATAAGEAWQAVCAELRGALTADNYRRWFAPTVALELAGNILTVGVPDAFHLQWLDRRLRGTIERAAAPILGDMTIRFVVTNQASA